jgi:hypothetical protein
MTEPVISIQIKDENLEHLAQGGPSLGPHLEAILRQEIEWYSNAVLSKVAGPMGGPATSFEKDFLAKYLYYKLVGQNRSLIPG